MKVVNTKKFYIEAAIIIALMFGFGFLPPIEPITAHGMRVIGILLACIYAWTIVGAYCVGLFTWQYYYFCIFRGIWQPDAFNGLILFDFLRMCGKKRIINYYC